VENIYAKTETEKATMSWRDYERRKARKHRGRHVGGPGKEDYNRGGTKGEVKHMQRRMTKPEVIRARRKDIIEIDALSGFTEPAKKYARKRKMKLFQRGRQVV
jgi:hypothetical protein